MCEPVVYWNMIVFKCITSRTDLQLEAAGFCEPFP